MKKIPKLKFNKNNWKPFSGEYSISGAEYTDKYFDKNFLIERSYIIDTLFYRYRIRFVQYQKNYKMLNIYILRYNILHQFSLKLISHYAKGPHKRRNIILNKLIKLFNRSFRDIYYVDSIENTEKTYDIDLTENYQSYKNKQFRKEKVLNILK